MSNDDFELIRPTGKDGTSPPPRGGLQLSRPLEARQPYLLSPELATTVNVALALGQPLLVTGEPGCGKTSLAREVARQLGTEVKAFYTQSTSVARDLLYQIDTVERFHDAAAHLPESKSVDKYLRFGALGEAIQAERTTVVLVDEVDKAPRDFPNDLLHEIEAMELVYHETTLNRPPVKSRFRHFVLFTSNRERNLPEPFLRRCLYTHIEFPKIEQLIEIVSLHVRDRVKKPQIAAAVESFLKFREEVQLVKRPSTAELIDWVMALLHLGVSFDSLKGRALEDMPALETILKLHEDRQTILGTG